MLADVTYFILFLVQPPLVAIHLGSDQQFFGGGLLSTYAAEKDEGQRNKRTTGQSVAGK